MDIVKYARTAGSALMTRGGKPLLLVKEHSPEILIGLSIVAGVGATITAARSTLQLEDRLDTVRADIARVKEKQLETHDDGTPIHNPTELQRELTKTYLKGAGNIARLYLPTLTLTGLSIASALGAHGILHKRNVALLAAYRIAEDNYEAYRRRVREDQGDDKDLEYVTGGKVTEEKQEDGSIVKVVSGFDPNKLHSSYGRFFDEGNPNYKRERDYNLIFLKGHQEMFNQRLQRYGFVFLNDVYEALGYDKTTAGQFVGWVMNGDGDNHIDFGIYAFENPQARRFVNGDEESIYLDFNVDGEIVNLIEGPRRR